MSSRLRMEVLPGFQEDLDALPDLRTRKMTIDLIVSAEIATAREATRPDRTKGMAGFQVETVHIGVRYDLDLDTGLLEPEEAARRIAGRI